MKLCTAPTVAQNVPIGEHRGSGRPAKVPIKSAWLSQGDTFISQFKAASLPAIDSTTTPTTTSTSTPSTFIPTTTNDAVASTNEAVASTNEAVASIPTTLTNEPKKRGRPKDTDEVKASKKAALDEAKATKKAAKEIQKNKV